MVDHIVPEVNSDEGNCRSNILLVDSDESSLFSLTKVLEQCNYGAVACKDSDECLATIREKKERFVFAIIDVSIPTIGGYQLCKLVRLETDIPVLLMSSTYSNAETMQKVQDHGALDFLLKPIKAEDVSKINLNARQSRSLSKSRNEWICTEEERASLAISDEPNHLGNDVSKKKEKGESVPEIQPLGRKKPRLIWTSELHKQFLEVVNELGVHKAVPKKIMEKMNNPELTRENIASHLQKYRHYVKKQKGELHQQPQAKSLPPQQEQHEIVSNEAPTSNCDVLNTPCIQAVASAGPTLEQDFQAPQEDTTTNYLMDQTHPLPVQMVHDPSPQLPNEINGSSKPPMDIMPQHEAACFSCYVDGQCLTIFEAEYNIHSDRWMQQNHKGQSSSVNFNSINASNPYQLDDNSFNNPNCRVDRDSQPIFSSGNNQVAHSEPMIYSMYDQAAHSQPMTNGVHVQGRLPTSQSNQPDKVNSITQR